MGKPLLETAVSFSCAMGKGMESLKPILQELPDKLPSERPALYACEDDHAVVDAFQIGLRRKIEAVPCMTDRMCSGMAVADDGRSISVDAEEWHGSIVFLGTDEQMYEEGEETGS